MSSHSNDISDGFRITELGPLPEDWQVVSLRDVFIEVDRRVANYRDINADRFPVLSLTKNYGLMLQSERFEKRIALEDVNGYKVVKNGEIVYNPYVIWEGAIHILDRFDYGLVSPVYPVLETNPERADPYFLDMMLRTPLAIAAYNRFAAGAVNRRRSIRKTDFMAIRLPLPSLTEQKAIARVLSTIQKSIEAQDRIIAAARELKKSLMCHLFTYGLVPVAEAEQVPLKETEIGLVPEHWEVVTLGEVITFTKKPNTLSIPERIAFIPMELLPSGASRFTNYENITRDELRSGIYCESGDILLAKITPCFENGKQGIVPASENVFYATTEVFPIKPKTSRIKQDYLFYLLEYPKLRQDVATKMEGTTGRKRVPKHIIDQYHIPLPSLEIQGQIANILIALDNKIETEKNRKAVLEALFKTMLHQLMTGKIRVKELEAQVS
jgi:type I restriction enzyme S subunit